ncbi:NAD(P)-dependent oxidoreductase [Marivirga lumbricoides]|uniref:NAD(P)-dependent oxidoreductase n=1 Tax=Marivirga lumbricoides TaxID=1046115 RepID=A0ABQ1MT85_9BACT|nr:NAD(P)-dependent oxidoreductase [Marivirga lumbricoides]
MSKILITGGTGGLGSAVANFLSEKVDKADIALLVRDPKSEKAMELAEKGFSLRVGDYSHKASLKDAFKDIEILYFVSGSDIANRMPQHKNVVEVADEAGIAHIFYTSVSLNQLSEDSALYNDMKAHFNTEEWIKNSQMKYTFLRHNLYSEVIAMFLGSKDQLLNSKSVFLPTEQGKVAFLPRIDLAEAGAKLLAEASEHVNKVYELNGSEKVSFEDVAQELSTITGENINYVSPGVEEFESTLKGYGVPAEYIGMMSAFGQAIAADAFDTPKTDIEAIISRKTQPVAEFLKAVYS